MKVGRGKKGKRTLAFYRVSFGLAPPFTCLVDGTFLQAALRQRIQLKEQLPRVMQGKCEPVLTQCCYRELAGVAEGVPSLNGALIVAKTIRRRHCAHGGYKKPETAPRRPPVSESESGGPDSDSESETESGGGSDSAQSSSRSASPSVSASAEDDGGGSDTETAKRNKRSKRNKAEKRRLKKALARAAGENGAKTNDQKQVNTNNIDSKNDSQNDTKNSNDTQKGGPKTVRSPAVKKARENEGAAEGEGKKAVEAILGAIDGGNDDDDDDVIVPIKERKGEKRGKIDRPSGEEIADSGGVFSIKRRIDPEDRERSEEPSLPVLDISRKTKTEPRKRSAGASDYAHPSAVDCIIATVAANNALRGQPAPKPANPKAEAALRSALDSIGPDAFKPDPEAKPLSIVVATQHAPLRSLIRSLFPGVPLVRIDRNVLCLEGPSDESKDRVSSKVDQVEVKAAMEIIRDRKRVAAREAKAQDDNLLATDKTSTAAAAVKDTSTAPRSVIPLGSEALVRELVRSGMPVAEAVMRASNGYDPNRPKKRKGPQGPNPLSCPAKKRKTENPSEKTEQGKGKKSKPRRGKRGGKAKKGSSNPNQDQE